MTTAEGDDLRAGTEDVDEGAEEKLQLSELFLMRPGKAQSRPILKIPSRSRPVPSRPAG